MLLLIGSVATAFGLDDVESEAVAILHAGRTEDGAQRSRGATLFADHFANVAGGDSKAKDGYVIVGNGFHQHGGGFIDQGPYNFLHQKLHPRNGIQSQTCFQNLSHLYTSEEMAHATSVLQAPFV
jgi:hypothetical protein